VKGITVIKEGNNPKKDLVLRKKKKREQRNFHLQSKRDWSFCGVLPWVFPAMAKVRREEWMRENERQSWD